ncbi:SDR family NAD(P)-dependent oxidoreductase [Conexibacter stalactiti]|uniref:SDR family NAD(P)-dependent oxidoreductase n=1 Tax=Conexibacter stalactiti TaxID=1940611 RepID=A0ABU4HTY4_9ACTN|nr:SDR family NAD(P)-dependent oxidoreductase [Conexibacter stalactiti]MDW5596777.1 SDR family NAD(P)-dependent oxidoreductase [Conexibacter stalactiti]MEC5037419.1 SDR family NAD(P)-dependent oxidoreductase [Conexibacter stalactiti]
MNDSSVVERTVVVTGATSGLGRAAAAQLVREPGVTVVVAARDAARGERAAAELTRAAAARASGRAIPLPLDLASLDSVRAFPAALDGARLPPLHALVANAGIQYTDRRHTTADGFEATFATNHLGHFLLIRLLLDRLAVDGRVVLVSSRTHKPQRLRNGGFPPPRWADARTLATPGEGSGQVAYSTSKLANAMTALELTRRIETLRPGAHIAVHALDPGLMPVTGLARDYPPLAQRLYLRAAPLLSALIPGATTAERSGAQLARMTLDPSFAAPPQGPRNGRYVELTRDGEPSAQARDPRLAAELWRDSEALVGLA